jgi:hypothetical protein
MVGKYLTVPTSPLGARTVSPTRRASGELCVDTLVVLLLCREAERDPAGLEGMLEDVVLDSDLRPRVEDFEFEVVE